MNGNKMMWVTDIDMTLMIFALAKDNGKQVGDSIQEEFEEMRNKYPDRFKHIGNTSQDADLITGNLRENGHKVLNLNELQRRKENDDKTIL